MSAANAGAAESASAATTDKTTFFIDPAPFWFDRLSADTVRSSPLRTNSGCDRPYAKGLALPGEFTSVTTCDSKTKTTAIAAFLGDSGLYRQIAAECCGKVTIFGVKPAIYY
jgi:hypothetical protein